MVTSSACREEVAVPVIAEGPECAGVHYVPKLMLERSRRKNVLVSSKVKLDVSCLCTMKTHVAISGREGGRTEAFDWSVISIPLVGFHSVL